MTQTNRRTDRQTDGHRMTADRAYAYHRAVIKASPELYELMDHYRRRRRHHQLYYRAMICISAVGLYYTCYSLVGPCAFIARSLSRARITLVVASSATVARILFPQCPLVPLPSAGGGGGGSTGVGLAISTHLPNVKRVASSITEI